MERLSLARGLFDISTVNQHPFVRSFIFIRGFNSFRQHRNQPHTERPVLFRRPVPAKLTNAVIDFAMTNNLVLNIYLDHVSENEIS